ncbi:MAG TPA: FAD-binding oxidoreductase [Dehalococcoidia bacterium]
MANTELDIEALRAELTGELLTPESAGYDECRRMHDPTIDNRPEVIVRAATIDDVVTAVKHAGRAGLPVAVRSGGHGLSDDMFVDVAMMVDLFRLKGVSVNPEKGTARVQAGATSGDLAGPAGAHGLALTTGDTSSVGIGGLASGGGIGFMVRKHGLTIDNLISAQVVTADGSLLTASETENADLFWGIRGGGGNLGIVTEFEFRMARVGEILGGAIVFPATREVIRGYVDYTPNAPEDLSTIGELMMAPPAPFIPQEWVGRPVFMVLVCWIGAIDEGKKALEPLRKLATPVADIVSPMPYPAIYNLTAEAAVPHGNSVRSLLQLEISDESIDKMIEAMPGGTAMINMVQIRGLGGALAKVPVEATAFSDRDARYFTTVIAVWADENEDSTPHKNWIRSLYEQIKHEASGVYINFLETETYERIQESYGENLERMVDLKRKWDPANMFRFNQNIKP